MKESLANHPAVIEYRNTEPAKHTFAMTHRVGDLVHGHHIVQQFQEIVWEARSSHARPTDYYDRAIRSLPKYVVEALAKEMNLSEISIQCAYSSHFD